MFIIRRLTGDIGQVRLFGQPFDEPSHVLVQSVGRLIKFFSLDVLELLVVEIRCEVHFSHMYPGEYLQKWVAVGCVYSNKIETPRKLPRGRYIQCFFTDYIRLFYAITGRQFCFIIYCRVPFAFGHGVVPVVL